MNNFKNKLIVCEAEDHAGKTTIAKALVEWLNNQNIPAIFTFQPGDTKYGEYADFIARLCKTKEFNLDTLSNLFAFLFDRSEQTAKVVLSALNAGQTVVCDRWWYSTHAYQIIGKQLKQRFGLSDDFVRQLNLLASHFVEPDYTLYFSRPEQNIKSTPDSSHDLFETESDLFKKRVKDAYLDMAKKYNFITIEVDENPEITLNKVLTAITQ